MKKTLVYFSIFIFGLSVCEAQDTLVYKTGEKVAVRIDSVGNKDIFYKAPTGSDQYKAGISQIYYIKYKDGTKYTIEQNKVDQNSNDIPDQRNFRPITINAGVGLSAMEVAVIIFWNNDFIGQGAGTFITQSLAYNSTIDYTLCKGFTVGIGGAYQWVTDNPYAPPINNVSETWAVEKITRYNMSLRFLNEFLKTDKADFYAGLRIGESIWTDNMLSNNPPNRYVTLVNPTFLSSTFKVSAQGFVGVRAYLLYNIAFHFEAGIGTPYIIEGGISFRFKTRKGASK
jgi:hypothetical protein